MATLPASFRTAPSPSNHATLSNPEDLEQRSVNLIVAPNNQKGRQIFTPNSPTHISRTSMERSIPDAHPLDPTTTERRSPYDAAPPGTEARHIASRARGHTNVKGRGRGQGNTKKQ